MSKKFKKNFYLKCLAILNSQNNVYMNLVLKTLRVYYKIKIINDNNNVQTTRIAIRSVLPTYRRLINSVYSLCIHIIKRPIDLRKQRWKGKIK